MKYNVEELCICNNWPTQNSIHSTYTVNNSDFTKFDARVMHMWTKRSTMAI